MPQNYFRHFPTIDFDVKNDGNLIEQRIYSEIFVSVVKLQTQSLGMNTHISVTKIDQMSLQLNSMQTLHYIGYFGW